MPKRVFRVREGQPLLDIASYGRGVSRENGRRLTPDQIDQIRRTVHRVPEVVVKVLPRASNDLKAAGQHLDYITRYGQLAPEGDDGERLEDQSGKAVLEEWNVDIDALRRQATLTATNGRRPPKLVHKLMFSMPPGTPSDKVLAAVRNFAREEFWGQHRYAFVLHTDEDHPHVHLVLKATSEEGVRLNVKKLTLRHWRLEFARHLRELGVPANATDRAVRGQYRKAKKDGIYRASLRGDSRHARAQAESAASELLQGRLPAEQGKSRIVETRRNIEHGWRTTIGLLRTQGQSELAAFVARFVDEMPLPTTDRELVTRALVEKLGVPALGRAPPVRSR